MNTISRGLFWRTAVTLAVVLDYFLFATGNPSITYSIFGGWFIVPLLLGALVFIWYGLQSFRTSQGRRVFAYYVVVVFAASIVLLPLSSTARSHAATTLESEVLAFAKDPGTRRVDASDASRALMTNVTKQAYTLQRDAFMPTFRRIDYTIKSKSAGTVTLILTMKWNGVPEVYMSTQSS